MTACTLVLSTLAGLGCPRAVGPPPATSGSFADRLGAALQHEHVGDRPLGEYLAGLRIEGCLEGDRADLGPALDRLRSLHRKVYEPSTASGKRRMWRSWEAQLASFSTDGRLLVEAWLDQPELARHLYLCEDGLPGAWRELDAVGFAERALTWFDAEVEARRGTLTGGGADGAAEVELLWDTRRRIERRFDAQFGEDAAEQRDRLTADLERLWEHKVEPHDTGRPVLYVPREAGPTPREVLQAARESEPATYSDHPRASGSGAQRATPGWVPPGPSGVSFRVPDPRDVAEAQRVRRSWWRARRAVMLDVRSFEERLAEIERALDGVDGTERDLLLAELDRLALSLDRSHVDLGRHRDHVEGYRTGRAGSDHIVRRFKRREVRAVGRRQERVTENHAATVETATAARAALAAAVAPPPGAGVGPGGATGGAQSTDGGAVAGDLDQGGGGGAGPEESEPGGQGSLVYEGPCPPPAAHWSDAIVQALRADHPFLDEVDARIFLSLLHRTWPGLGDPSEVEAVVLQRLEDGVDLRLRAGRAGDLSDQYDPELSPEQQEVIVFYVWLSP